MASAQIVETSVTNNSPSQESNHPDDLFQSRYVTPGFKTFSYLVFLELVKFTGKHWGETFTEKPPEPFLVKLFGLYQLKHVYHRGNQ